MRVMDNGGSINADFQCGAARSNGRVGKEPILVMNTCKDFRPSQYSVCVCLPGLRYFHVDVRHFGMPSRSLTPKGLREHMTFTLGHSGFSGAAALWEYARQHEWPRILHEEACNRGGIAVDDADRATTATIIAAAKTASCRALA